MCHWWVSGTLWWNCLKWSLPICGTPSMIQFKHSINALPSSASVGNMEKNHRFATAAYVLAWCQQILYSLQLSVSSTISCLFPKISIFLPTRLGFQNKIGPPFFRTPNIIQTFGKLPGDDLPGHRCAGALPGRSHQRIALPRRLPSRMRGHWAPLVAKLGSWEAGCDIWIDIRKVGKTGCSDDDDDDIASGWLDDMRLYCTELARLGMLSGPVTSTSDVEWLGPFSKPMYTFVFISF